MKWRLKNRALTAEKISAGAQVATGLQFGLTMSLSDDVLLGMFSHLSLRAGFALRTCCRSLRSRVDKGALLTCLPIRAGVASNQSRDIHEQLYLWASRKIVWQRQDLNWVHDTRARPELPKHVEEKFSACLEIDRHLAAALAEMGLSTAVARAGESPVASMQQELLNLLSNGCATWQKCAYEVSDTYLCDVEQMVRGSVTKARLLQRSTSTRYIAEVDIAFPSGRQCLELIMDHEVVMNAVSGRLEKTPAERSFDVTLHASDDELMTFTAVVPATDIGAQSVIDTSIEQDAVDALSRQLLGRVEDHHSMLHAVLSMMGAPMLAWSSDCPIGGGCKASALWQSPDIGYFQQLLEILATSCQISNVPTTDLTSLSSPDALASLHPYLGG
mmetsp:Transcript_93658/g.176104  ORF Transcript_93658/g.176104 Transcript_93658/m.176104 type:complete len:387 (+) Transcript_93658:104-1264(+)